MESVEEKSEISNKTKLPPHMINHNEDEDEEEEDEDLFEIDLEIVSKIPPPHYWESYFTATSNTLLANCLLPIADVSCAVPIVMRDGEESPPQTEEDQTTSFQAALLLQYTK